MSNSSLPFVSVDWLADRIDDPSVRIIDVRWKSRYEGGKGISLDDPDGYRAGHIPGAVFAGMVADLSDPAHAMPDMLAPPDRFAAAMSRLGVGEDTVVVVYDNMGVPLGSARLWWALSSTDTDCGGITMLQDAGDPTRFTLIEHWPSREIFLGPHMQQPYIQSFIQSAGAFLAGPPDISFWHPVSGA